MISLSIIAPTMNEPSADKTIRELIRTFGKSAEIIVVDKSTDANRRKLERTGARVIRQESIGYENALMDGFREAKGDIISTIDPDGTYSVSDFKRVVSEVKSGKSDFVSGNRFGKLHRGAMTTSIAFGNKFLTGLYRLLYKREVHDVLSGSFAMTRKAFESIRNEETYRAGTLFFEIELARRGFKIIDIPISYHPRVGSESKISRFKPIYGMNMARHTIQFARDYNPLLLFGSIGLILILLGLLVGAFVLANYLSTGTLNEIGRALIAFMLIVIGFLSILGGLILDLLLRLEKELLRGRR